MQLIGMLDSPYVRRSFISGRLLGISFEHKSLSVFRNFAEFHAINPLVRAPTLLLDDGQVLVDSNLIIRYFESQSGEVTLEPTEPSLQVRNLCLTSLGLALCDKAVQLYYEIGLRPEHLRWPEWITRVTGQLRDTAAALEAQCECAQGWLLGARPCQADVTTAVAWRFTRHVLPQLLDASLHPRLADLSARAEALPEFRAGDFD